MNLFYLGNTAIIIGSLIIYAVYSYCLLGKYKESTKKVLLTIIAGILSIYILSAILSKSIVNMMIVHAILPLLLGTAAGYGMYKAKTIIAKIAVALVFLGITITYIMIFAT